MPRAYQQLTKDERDRLSLFRAEGRSVRDIARMLGRSPSTICRELKRNAPPINDGYYLPHKAQERADQRKARAHERQRLRDPRLRSFVTRMLCNGWSPERISGRLKKLKLKSISHEAIYQWIYADARNLASCLARAHRRRLKRGHSKRHRSSHIPSRTPIAQRPTIVSQRQQPGHWESDTIVSLGHRSALQVVVERMTRYVRLNKLRAKEASAMRKTLNKSLAALPKHLRRSITYDNGSENTQHMLVNRRLGTASYFCDPNQSWQKGSVENAAGLVRRRLPKKTDFSTLTVAEVKRIEKWINHLPRKCLGYSTSAEAFRSVALAG